VAEKWLGERGQGGGCGGAPGSQRRRSGLQLPSRTLQTVVASGSEHQQYSTRVWDAVGQRSTRALRQEVVLGALWAHPAQARMAFLLLGLQEGAEAQGSPALAWGCWRWHRPSAPTQWRRPSPQSQAWPQSSWAATAPGPPACPPAAPQHAHSALGCREQRGTARPPTWGSSEAQRDLPPGEAARDSRGSMVGASAKQ